jgi:gag-polypeptide of LTR copia-type
MADTSSTLASYPFSYQLPLKLNHNNYLSWMYLVLPHVRGHDLLGYLNGSCPAPPETISTGANPAFKIWSRQDQLLLAWLLSSISESVVSQVVHCSTSADPVARIAVAFLFSVSGLRHGHQDATSLVIERSSFNARLS